MRASASIRTTRPRSTTPAGRGSSTWPSDPRVVAIGETGLDYDRVFSPIPDQLANLRRNLRARAEHGKPAILHCRSAAGRRDAQDALARTRDGSAGDGRPAGPAADRSIRSPARSTTPRRCSSSGAVLSFSGLVFRAGEEASAEVAAAACPHDRLLVETDSPFLAPPGAPRRRGTSPNGSASPPPGSPSAGRVATARRSATTLWRRTTAPSTRGRHESKGPAAVAKQFAERGSLMAMHALMRRSILAGLAAIVVAACGTTPTSPSPTASPVSPSSAPSAATSPSAALRPPRPPRPPTPPRRPRPRRAARRGIRQRGGGLRGQAPDRAAALRPPHRRRDQHRGRQGFRDLRVRRSVDRQPGRDPDRRPHGDQTAIHPGRERPPDRDAGRARGPGAIRSHVAPERRGQPTYDGDLEFHPDLRRSRTSSTTT